MLCAVVASFARPSGPRLGLARVRPGRAAASAAQPGSTLDSSSPKMASASSPLNAVSHNHFAALSTEDMDFCAGGNDTMTTDTINDQEVLRSTGRTTVAVRGNDTPKRHRGMENLRKTSKPTT
ncbi:hypothetical protein MRX96_047595 [Rhipicephalus microplus]